MATKDRDDKPKRLIPPPKKATKEGYYTVEPRPFNYGEYELMVRLVDEFRPFSLADYIYTSQHPPKREAGGAWIETGKKTAQGKKVMLFCTDTPERAEFIDYLFDKLDLPIAQATLADIFKETAKGHPLREETDIRSVSFDD